MKQTKKLKNKKIFWTIVVIILLLVSCDRDAFQHLQNAAKFFKLGMYDQAVIELKTSNRFLKDSPQFQNSMYKHLMWGIIALKEGDQQQAIENFSKALKAEPKEEQIRFILSALYLQQKDYQKAIDLFNDKKYLDVTYGAPDYLQGIKAYYAGNTKKAINHFEKTLQILNEEYIYFSDDPSQKIVIEQLHFALYSMLGEGNLQLKKYRTAIKYYSKALEIDKQNIILDAKLKIAMLTYQTTKEPKNSGLYATIAYYYSVLNLNDKAVLYYKKALRLYPRSAPAYLGLATVYKNKLDYKSSENALRKALLYAKKPKMIASIYLALGQIYIEQDKLPQAIGIFSKANNLDSENISIQNDLKHTQLLVRYKKNQTSSQTNNDLAYSYLERKNYLLALKHFNYVTASDSVNLEAILGKGRIYYLLEKQHYALTNYKKALKISPANLKALYGITDVYMAMEHFDIAITTLKKVLKKDRHNVLLRHKLAYIYFYAGQNSEAIKEWNYVRDNINNEELSAVIAKIIEVIG